MSLTAKIAAGLGVALVLTLALGAALFYRGELNTERAAHNATRTKYASEKAWWLYDQRSANATISGLSVQASGLLRNRAADRAAETDFFNIFAGPGTLELNDCGKAGSSGQQPAPSEGVNDETNKAAVRHINGAFARVGVRGEGQ